MSSSRFSHRTSALFVFILHFLAIVNSNAMDAGIEHRSKEGGNVVNPEEGRGHGGFRHDGNAGGNVMTHTKTKVVPPMETEMNAVTGNAVDTTSTVNVDYPDYVDDDLGQNSMVSMADNLKNADIDKTSSYRETSKGDRGDESQYRDGAAEYEMEDGGNIEVDPNSKERKIEQNFQLRSQQNWSPENRRLRFIKRRLRFIKRDGEKMEDPELDKRRLRFVKKDLEEDTPEKRRLRFIKRHRTWQEKDTEDVFPSADSRVTSQTPIPGPYPTADYDSHDTNQLPRADVMRQGRGAFPPQETVLERHQFYPVQSKRHVIQRRSVDPYSLFSGFGSLTPDQSRARAKRWLSINQPLYLLTARLMKQRQEENDKLRKKLAAIGKRAEAISSPQTDDVIVAKTVADYVDSLFDASNLQPSFPQSLQ